MGLSYNFATVTLIARHGQCDSSQFAISWHLPTFYAFVVLSPAPSTNGDLYPAEYLTFHVNVSRELLRIRGL